VNVVLAGSLLDTRRLHIAKIYIMNMDRSMNKGHSSWSSVQHHVKRTERIWTCHFIWVDIKL